MKMRKLPAVFAAAGLILAIAPSLAQDPQGAPISPLPNGILEKLPIETQGEMLDWLVNDQTNGLSPRQAFTYTIVYTDTNSQTRQYQTQLPSGIKFNDYDEYLDMACVAGWRICSVLKTNPVYAYKSGTKMSFRTSTLYLPSDGGLPVSGFTGFVDLDPLETVSFDSFRNLRFLFDIRLPIPVSGMQKARIEKRNKPFPSWYEWNNGTVTKSEDASNASSKWYSKANSTEVRNGLLILGSSDCDNTNDLRITVTAYGKTYVYGRFGDLIRSPELKFSSHRLDVTSTRGSDLVVETSVDMTNWSRFTGPSKAIGNQATTFIIPADLPKQFFRAYSR